MKFEIKTNDSVVVITLFDRSFTSFCLALNEVAFEHKEKEIWMMQSVEKKDEPLRVFIVFKF